MLPFLIDYHMSQSNIPQITADEVLKVIQEKKDIMVIDVRTPEEYRRGKIAGSINIPIDSISEQVTTIIPDKNKMIYVYCLSGSRSEAAVEVLQQLGYTNTLSMTNGLLLWRSKKYPLST